MHKRGVAHRDLKPENILLVSKEKSNLDIKITDFGFSCFFEPETGLEIQLGTALYMAPEIINAQKYDEKVDIWSIGIITYMLLTGRTPYGGKNKQELKNNIATKDVDWSKPYVESLSSEAKKFMKKCLTRDIGDRPSAE